MATPAQMLSKVASSNVEDQLKATGEAQVIVLLAPAKAGLATATSAGPSQDLLNCFKLTDKSRWTALARATTSLAKGAGLAILIAIASALVVVDHS